MNTITSTRRSTVTDYASAAAYLGTRTSRPAGNNTTVHRLSSDSIAVRLHRTDIIVYWPGSVMLNSGGYRTVTTAARMNSFTSGIGVSFRKAGDTVRIAATDITVAFYDGIVIFNLEAP